MSYSDKELADVLLTNIYNDLLPTAVAVRDFTPEEKTHLVSLHDKDGNFLDKLSLKYALEYKSRNINFFFRVIPNCCHVDELLSIPFFLVSPVFFSRFVCVLENRKKITPRPKKTESVALSQTTQPKLKAPIVSEPEDYYDVIPNETYNIPEKARAYVESRYDARVYDLTVLLKSFIVPDDWIGTIHVPGDGAGCGYRACANAGFLKFDVSATEPSAIMRGLAKERGNVVSSGTADDMLGRVKKHDLVIISHVLDYYPELAAESLRRGAYVLVYERKTNYSGFGKLRPTGHTKSHQTATNWPGFRYNGAPISISHRTIMFSQSLDLYVLMKYHSFVFHGPSTLPLIPYIRAMDYNKGYSYQLLGFKDAQSLAEQYDLFTLHRHRDNVLHIFCDESDTLDSLPPDASLYSMRLQQELTTGVLYEIFGFAGTIPLSIVKAVCGTYSILGFLNGKISDGLYYPLENHCSNARVNFPYLMRGTDSKGFTCVPIGTAATVYGGHGDYSSYHSIWPIPGYDDYKLVRFKKECNATVELQCKHPALNVGNRHMHVFAVRNKSRVQFHPSQCIVSLLKTYGLPKLFKLSYLASRLSKFSIDDWRDAVEGFVNYHVTHKQIVMIDHEWVFYPEGNDTYEKCIEFCMKPFDEILSLTHGTRRDLLKWLLPKIASIARLPEGATYTSTLSFESVFIDGHEYGRNDVKAV